MSKKHPDFSRHTVDNFTLSGADKLKGEDFKSLEERTAAHVAKFALHDHPILGPPLLPDWAVDAIKRTATQAMEMDTFRDEYIASFSNEINVPMWHRRNGKSHFNREYRKLFEDDISMNERRVDPHDLTQLAGGTKHGPRGYHWDIDITLGPVYEKQAGQHLSVAFGLPRRVIADILNLIRHTHLQHGGRDGKPFDEFPRAVNQLTRRSAELRQVQVNQARNFTLGPLETQSVADREIEAKYRVEHEHGTAIVNITFAPDFFNRMSEDSDQNNENDNMKTKENEILNLIDESYTTVQVSFDLNNRMGEDQALKEALKHYDKDDGYTYKVLKGHDLEVGNFVAVKARGELKVACVTAVHEESCIEDNRAYGWVVDLIRTEGVARQEERDAKIIKEIRAKEKAKQKQELRDHVVERLGIENLNNLQALGHDAESEATDQGASACMGQDGE